MLSLNPVAAVGRYGGKMMTENPQLHNWDESVSSSHQGERVDVKKIDTALRIIEHFRTIYAEIPAQIMSTFLFIAKRPGASMTDVANATGQSLTSAARNCKILAEVRGWDADAKRPEAGLGLIEIEINPENQRQRLVKLTRKGERFMATLGELI